MSFIKVAEDGGVTALVLDRPPANALSAELVAEFHGVLDGLEADPGARCVVIGSENTRFFMGGADIANYTDLDGRELAVLVGSYRRLFCRVRDLPIPTIAAVDGHAQGGGCELMLACDLRVIGPNAKIGVPEINLGGLPSAGGTQWLAPLIGYDRALEMQLTGRSVRAEEAVRIGLATMQAEDPLVHARGLAAAIAGQSPTAVRWIKRCTRAASWQDRDGGTALEHEATTAVGDTAEFRAGIDAFLTRRAS